MSSSDFRRRQILVYSLMPYLLGSISSKVSEFRDPALFHSESELMESKHVQTSKQGYSRRSGLAACLGSSNRAPESLFNIY